MTAIATKLQVGTAALAVAAATTLVPVAAQATPLTQPLPAWPACSATMGSALLCAGETAGPAENAPNNLVSFTWGIPILGPLIFGSLGLLNKEVCIGGVSLRTGPYGSVTAALGLGC